MMKVVDNVYIAGVIVENAEDLIKKIGGDIQIVTAECYEQVAFAAILVVRSFQRGTNHARTLGGELLLRLAGTLQIREAISTNGVRNGENYLVVFGDERRAREVLDELGLREFTPHGCSNDRLKTFLEKSALVEGL